MAAIRAGERLTSKQRSRVTLSVRDSSTISLLGGLNIEKDQIDEIHAFGKRLLSDRNRWSINRHRRGLFGGGRLSKDAADRALALALAHLRESEVAR